MIFDALHKKPWHIGPGLCRILHVDFRELLFSEGGSISTEVQRTGK
jgi:hypothetical protein